MKRAVLACLLLGLLVVLLSGCALDDLLSNMVNREPRAVVDARPVQGVAPLSVKLDACYSHDEDGTIVETRWDLGDPAATGSRLESALVHEYRTPGTYLVKLTVTDDEGAMNHQQVAVVVTDPPPVANAAASDLQPHPGDEITFDASGSTDVFGEIVGFHWDFGDGTTACTEKAAHAYKAVGAYVVTLTVTDDGGLTAQAVLNVDVTPGKSDCGGGTCGGDGSPLAVISIRGGSVSCSGTSGTAGVPLTFDGTYSYPNGTITLYHWDFGDGTTATGATVTHAYAEPWQYAVTLTVSVPGGATGRASASVRIGGSGDCTTQ